MCGFFGIGIYCPQHKENIGTLWRSAYQLGATFVFTIGRPYQYQCSDTLATTRRIPLYHYLDYKDFREHLPHDCQVVGIEMGGIELASFTHPQRCVYLLGAEDNGLPEHIQLQCQHVVSLSAVRTMSFNVAVAGSIVMYDRFSKSPAKENE